ncbi:MAG: biotin--[acetyl-CoA-carboxylase] ligase [bacterium]|jgi:BirA family biotin operon repressor/biotin-[acetyl-CoA-carboxylase] ligase|nr:biotin--[acetyl-CoA-carboxylase] ligase [candidate division KSB1 bacterium]MDH7559563.1 biotin--[acetyl-CoA-carboxylase] ligase [bacterium]
MNLSPRVALDKARLATLLKTKHLGRAAQFFSSVASTNEVARELAQRGAPHGYLVSACAQTAGRGRAGRTWYSAPGAGLWFSLVLRPTLAPQRCGLISLAAALAVAEAIAKITGIKAQLKWPNDVLVAGKKLCGILAETELIGDRLKFAVLGVGINTNRAHAQRMPRHIQATATWLSDHTSTLPDEMALLASILGAVEKRWEELEAGHLARLLRAWRTRCMHLGKPVRIVEPHSTLQGVAEDIAEDGALLLRTASGELRAIVAGDCQLLPE